MIGVADGPYELKNGSSILTRRGGTDANAPESPQEAIPRDWHVCILGPQFLENLGKGASNNFQQTWTFIFTGSGLAEMSNGCIVLDNKLCPDPLEALKSSGDP